MPQIFKNGGLFAIGIGVESPWWSIAERGLGKKARPRRGIALMAVFLGSWLAWGWLLWCFLKK